MTDPISLIARLSEATDRLFLWTHWFEPDTTVWNPAMRDLIGEKWRIDNTVTVTFRGRELRMVPQGYGASLGWGGFCGGPEDHSHWLYREDLLALLADLGYSDVRLAFDNPGHQNGPCCSILAQR
jgi:hypothetical protein